ncbi:MAG: rRNA maturation RNase YbeY [Actinobacteria bacterium]|nr:rRNA maturation RNase YbeY [Actinomycetota bacterium]
MTVRASSEVPGSKHEIRHLKTVLKKAMNKLSCNALLEVSLLLVGEDRMKDLNSQFRNRDEATDVLAFPMMSTDEIESIEDAVDRRQQLIGDIVICVPYAEKQSRELGVSFESEMELLAVHGLLHLFGYVDASEEGAEEMAVKASELLGRKV